MDAELKTDKILRTTTKIYLDSSVIMAFILGQDTTVPKIFRALKSKNIESYISLLTLTEIANLASISDTIKYKVENIEKVLTLYNIKIFSDYPENLISGTATLIIENLSYSDILHLKIANLLKVKYFITIDFGLLQKKNFDNIKIIRPDDFIEVLSDL